jgi:hypothetical protein
LVATESHLALSFLADGILGADNGHEVSPQGESQQTHFSTQEMAGSVSLFHLENGVLFEGAGDQKGNLKFTFLVRTKGYTLIERINPGKKSG